MVSVVVFAAPLIQLSSTAYIQNSRVNELRVLVLHEGNRDNSRRGRWSGSAGWCYIAIGSLHSTLRVATSSHQPLFKVPTTVDRSEGICTMTRCLLGNSSKSVFLLAAAAGCSRIGHGAHSGLGSGVHSMCIISLCSSRSACTTGPCRLPLAYTLATRLTGSAWRCL